MKKASLALIFILFLSVLAACGNDDESSSDSNGDSGEKVVKVWFGREDFIPADNFEKFHEEHPDIRVEADVVPLEQAVSDFMRNHSAGNEPDIVQVFHDNVGTMVSQDTLMDISEYVDQWESDDADGFNKILSQAWDIASWEDKVYGMGIHVGPYWHVYRKDWFEEEGLEIPTDYDELLEAARVLDTDEHEGYALVGGREHPAWWFSSLFVSMGGEYSSTGLPQIDSEAGHYLIDFYQTLMREELIDPSAISWSSGEMRGAFIGGNAAMAPIGDNIFPLIQEEMTYGEEWTAAPQPVRPGQESNQHEIWGWPMMVSSNTENPEAVMEVFKYLSDTEIVDEVAKRYQPTTNSEVMQSEEYVEAKPWAADFEEEFANTIIMPSHINQGEVMNILVDVQQEALQNTERDPAEIAAEYQEKLNELDN
ncbi:ABC transporter substrate-binding protein [Saliterribacillus persicus]|uniref:ABC-type glycerol-3-phosphate transport system substrate-binding protein n=1 Tax=Saliterribacillus persicus TaxID=930114 RepID=A0A368YDY1_9BACI|nr:sugar ABC transporter substrate-binding protein [Saliterribacillus persicus]RCW77546.1 ABC-type glycerol-3-phosphate transport system substrate-binding protein [Saliterribacillus persicus]